MLGFGALCGAASQPVASALSLVVSFLGLAALVFHASRRIHRIHPGASYAGAVMVLFFVHHHAARL